VRGRDPTIRIGGSILRADAHFRSGLQGLTFAHGAHTKRRLTGSSGPGIALHLISGVALRCRLERRGATACAASANQQPQANIHVLMSAGSDVYALFHSNRRQMPATRITLLLHKAGMRVLLCGPRAPAESSGCDKRSMNYMDDSDEILIERHALGDVAAFELLYRRHELRTWR
jgi:hypothetical protein